MFREGINNSNMMMYQNFNFPNMNMQNFNMLNYNFPMNMPNWNFPMNMNNCNMPMNMNNFQMMNNFLMPSMNNVLTPGMNIGGNDDWMKGYEIGNMQNQNKFDGMNKINVIFKTTQGMIKNISIEGDKTINESIKIYLNRVGKPELFNRTNEIYFLSNGNKLNINSNQKIEDFFRGFATPAIIVNDVKNLIGA